MILSQLVLALLAANTSGVKKVGPEIFVRTDRSVSVERLAAAVGPIGFVESREKGTRCYLIQLDAGVDSEMAKQRLERVPGVKALEAIEEPVDLNSIRSLDRKIVHLKAEEVDEKEKKGKHEKGGLDYLEAYRDFVFTRAYPNDSIDWPSIAQAREHALKMPPTKFPPMPHKPGIVSGLQSWEFMGPTNLQAAPNSIDFGLGAVTGRLNAVCYDPVNSQTIYVGGSDGGLWKSSDSGTNWQWLSASWPQLPVNCIAVDPTNDLTIYVGLGDYHGGKALAYDIMKTTDGGLTWQQIGATPLGQVGVDSILIDPTDHNTLIVGTGDTSHLGLIQKSIDGGSHWTKSLGYVQNDQSEFPSIAASVVQNGKVRFWAVEAGQAANAHSRIFYSDDHGSSWSESPSPIQANNGWFTAYEVATSPTDPQTVYVLDSQNQKLVYTRNNGAKWTDVSANLPTGDSTDYNFSQAGYDYHLECGNRVTKAKNSDVLYLGEIDIQQSLDQGKTWSSLGGPSWLTQSQGSITHNDQHCLAVCPSNPNVCLFTNDGGVYQLSYNPTTSKNTITSLNKNLGNTTFAWIACHPTQPNYVMGGTQDNGSPLSTGDLGNWVNVLGGDGGGCAINQSNPLIAYATYEKLAVRRTGDGWQSNTDISPPVPSGEVLPFSPRIVLAPSDQSKLYTATNNLWMYNDNTQRWSEALSNNPNSIFALAVAPSNSDCIYTGSIGNTVGIAPSGIASLGSIGAPLENGIIYSISVSPTHESDILIGYANAPRGDNFWRCSNTFKAGSLVWENVAGSGDTSLPGGKINSIVRDIDDPENTWYVATDVGVFQTSDAGTTWTNAGATYGLPNVIVSDLVVVPGTRYLNAGTYGRGMWRIYLPPSGSNLNGLGLSPTTVMGGASSTGTVALTKNAPSGGTTIQLSGTSGISVPSFVTVPYGSQSTTFTVSTNPVSSTLSATVTATQGSVVWTAPLTVQAPVVTGVSYQENPIVGGTTAFGQVAISGPAPSGGLTISLSSNQASLQVPAWIVVPVGQSVGYFQVTTKIVTSSFTGTVTASGAGTSAQGSVTVVPATVQGLSLSNSSIVGGSNSAITGTLTLSGPTPSAGLRVTLASSNKSAATVPASVTVKVTASPYTYTFTVTHLQVKTTQSATITATEGRNKFPQPLQVTPFQVTALALSPEYVVGGSPSVGLVTLNAVPVAKVTVGLSSTGASVGLPATVDVGAGKQNGSFNVTTSAVNTLATSTITGTLNGSSAQGTLSIVAPHLVGVSVKPSTVKGSSRAEVIGTVTLSGPAPKGGQKIMIATSNPKATSVPASITIAAGRTSGTFVVSHVAVGSTVSVNLGASLGDSTKIATLTVTH